LTLAQAQLAAGGYDDEIAARRRERGEVVAPENATVDAKTTPLQDLVPAWLEAKAGAGLKAKTVNNYDQMFRYYVLPALGHLPLAQITVPTVRKALNALFARGYERATVRHAKAALSAFLTDAVEDGTLPVNLILGLRVVKPSTTESKQEELERLRSEAQGKVTIKDKAWTQDDLKTFLDANADEWYAPVFGVMAMTGLRRAEVCGLRWSLVDLKAGTLQVLETTVTVEGRAQADTPKNKSSFRTIPLRPEAVALLKLHRSRQVDTRRERQRAGLPWGDHMGDDFVLTRRDGVAPHPDSLRKLYRAMCERAGVPPLRIHDLRGTSATHFAQQGMSMDVVAKILGHSSAATTRAFYRDVQSEELRDAVAKLPRLFTSGQQPAEQETDHNQGV
ncbi:site-specific integrase, partial [Deinococcus sp.]|uniref:tyrosine-type recombinase/integrase n=1 Tax=Deinococcus sp. TaxID=47478 RepID=UPI002869E1CE